MGRIYCICVVLLVACLVAPANAWRGVSAGDICYGCGDDTISGLTTLIAFLEADPDIDEAFKGPIISRARKRILWLRTASGPRLSASAIPCCYARKPLYIR